MAGEDLARAHLELLRQDARDEVKKRIEQRDKYSGMAPLMWIRTIRIGLKIWSSSRGLSMVLFLWHRFLCTSLLRRTSRA